MTSIFCRRGGANALGLLWISSKGLWYVINVNDFPYITGKTPPPRGRRVASFVLCWCHLGFFPAEPSMYGINYLLLVCMLVVFIMFKNRTLDKPMAGSVLFQVPSVIM